MGKVGALFALGLGFFSIGSYWKLQDEVIDRHIAKFILNNEYSRMASLEWDLIPWIVIFVGIVCLVAAGMSIGRRTSE